MRELLRTFQIERGKKSNTESSTEMDRIIEFTGRNFKVYNFLYKKAERLVRIFDRKQKYALRLQSIGPSRNGLHGYKRVKDKKC